MYFANEKNKKLYFSTFVKKIFSFEFCLKLLHKKCAFWLHYTQILKCVILYEKALIAFSKIKLKNIFVKVQSCPVTIM